MNWKTTISGIGFIAALLAFVLSQDYPFLAPYKQYLVAAAGVLGFINAYWQKDKDVTGGTR